MARFFAVAKTQAIFSSRLTQALAAPKAWSKLKQMRNFLLLLASLILSNNAFSQNALTVEEQMVAEVYASYVSNQAFIVLCSKLDHVNNYEVAFNSWKSKHQRDIEQGKKVLSRQYSSQSLEVDDVFKWKIEAEKSYFNASSASEKIEACKNLLSSISNSEN